MGGADMSGQMNRLPGDPMTVAQVAAYLQLNKLTIYRYIREGRLPAVKLGRSLRVLQEDVLHFLESQKVGGPSAVEAPVRAVASLPRPEAARLEARRDRAPETRMAEKYMDEIYVGPSREERATPMDAVVRANPLDWVIRGLH